MRFRYARHTNDLNSLIKFYTNVIGLEVLGGFENHSNYNGVFLGLPNLDWHLEFTESNEKANHHADADDLIVFYLNSIHELNAIKKDALKFEFPLVQSKNDYWQTNGIEIKDPDNYGVVLTVLKKELKSIDSTTQLIRDKGINTWGQLLSEIKKIPYGRNSDRSNFELVMVENKGTCSSKHALLKELAKLNQIDDVKLVMGIYKMNESNTEGIGNILTENGLDYIPEAHCYLKVNGKRIDLTNPTSDIQKLRDDIIEEKEIEPFQVGQFKVDFHKEYIRNWLEQIASKKTFDEIWLIREQCIEALGE